MRLCIEDLLSRAGPKFISPVYAVLTLPDGREIAGTLRDTLLFRLGNLSKDIMGVYLISAMHSSLIYVGSSKSLRRRFREHCVDLKAGNSKNKQLQDMYATAPYELAFDVRLFEITDRNLAYEVEEVLINFTAEKGLLANMSLSSKGQSLRHFPEETRKRLSDSATGRKLSDETKHKLSLIHMGKVLSPAHKLNLANANKEKWENKEFVEKWKKSKCKQVEVDGVTYSSLTEAGNHHNCHAGRVFARIKSSNEKFNGWKYIV
jgi:group I intron endonuclease